MSASQRNKGAAYEREICKDLQDTLGVRVRRNLGQSRDGGDDITLAKQNGRFRIECKRRNTIACEAWLEQAEASCKLGDVPIVIMRSDGADSMVLIRFQHFMPLLCGEIVKEG